MATTPRLRFAPSPTGKLHIGGARTALFAWAWARRLGGRFLLRIEDTDRERSTQAFEDAILDGLRWLGIDWDEGPDVGGDYGPYRQTERFERYREAAQRLLASGHAYRCFQSAEAVEAARGLHHTGGGAFRSPDRDLSPEESLRRSESEPFVLRARVRDGETRFVDRIRGEVVYPNREIDDWVMVRTTGDPTYNFVVVCDDADMAVTHVMRGEEHLANTPKQVLLYEALGLDAPEFAHLPLLLGTDGKKLSKRTGDTALEDYREQGYPPEAVLNFLCLQGWALDDSTEVFSLDQLVQNFDPKDVSKGGSVFDLAKFHWLAGEYLRAEPVEELAEHAVPFMVAAGLASRDELGARRAWYTRAVASVQERATLYSEIPCQLAYLFAADDAVEYDAKAEAGARKHAERAATLGAYLEWVTPRLGTLAPPELGQASKDWVAERGLKIPALFQPLRCALSGAAGGPDLFEIMELLGPAAVRVRIESAMRRLA